MNRKYVIEIDCNNENQLIIRGDSAEFILLESEWRNGLIGSAVRLIDDAMCDTWATANAAFADFIAKGEFLP